MSGTPYCAGRRYSGNDSGWIPRGRGIPPYNSERNSDSLTGGLGRLHTFASCKRWVCVLAGVASAGQIHWRETTSRAS